MSEGEDPEKTLPREAELIAGVRESDVIGVVAVGRVRVVASGFVGDSGKGSAVGGGGGRKGK
jgi:hypothetical protein